MGDQNRHNTHTHVQASEWWCIFKVNRNSRRGTSFGVSNRVIDSGQVYDIIVESSMALSRVCVCVFVIQYIANHSLH